VSRRLLRSSRIVSDRYHSICDNKPIIARPITVLPEINAGARRQAARYDFHLNLPIWKESPESVLVDAIVELWRQA